MKPLEKAFLGRIERHKGIFYKIAKMYMDSQDDQQDLFQEIVYQLWKSYPNFQEKSAFSTWAYRVALNTAITFLKSEKKRSFIAREEHIETIKIASEESSEQEQQVKLMYDAIHQLDEIDKALIFYYLEGLSGKEISIQMGFSEVNARVRLSRAKTKLTEIIQKLNH